MRLTSLILAPAIVLASACSDSSGPNGRALGISFSGQSATATAAAGDITVTGGSNTLVITKAQVVVRRVKLKGTTAGTCSDDDSATDDCRSVFIGPMLVDLPLTTGGVTSLSATVPPDTYRQIEFRIHKPGSDGPDAAFRAANPTFANISIRVEGTFNGSAFVYTSTLDEKQTLTFNPPVTVGADNQNVTIQFDIASWFVNGSTVINPATASSGGANENLVRDKIRYSLRAIEDDDRNGR
jgi:hypothetical protein